MSATGRPTWPGDTILIERVRLNDWVHVYDGDRGDWGRVTAILKGTHVATGRKLIELVVAISPSETCRVTGLVNVDMLEAATPTQAKGEDWYPEWAVSSALRAAAGGAR